MASDDRHGRPAATFIYNFPKTRGRPWPGDLLEAAYLAMLILWAGMLLMSAAVVPSIAREQLLAREAAELSVRLSTFINFLGGTLGTIFLTSLLIFHLTGRRGSRVLLVQMGLLLGMVLALLGCQVCLTERIAASLRALPLSPDASGHLPARLAALQHAIQALHGLALLLTAATFLVAWWPRRQPAGGSRAPGVIMSLRR